MSLIYFLISLNSLTNGTCCGKFAFLYLSAGKVDMQIIQNNFLEWFIWSLRSTLENVKLDMAELRVLWFELQTSCNYRGIIINHILTVSFKLVISYFDQTLPSSLKINLVICSSLMRIKKLLFLNDVPFMREKMIIFISWMALWNSTFWISQIFIRHFLYIKFLLGRLVLRCDFLWFILLMMIVSNLFHLSIAILNYILQFN